MRTKINKSRIFTEEKLKGLLDYIGIRVESETSTHFITMCPFHPNSDTPAFNIDKRIGIWRCWNPSCGRSGTIESLVRDVLDVDYVRAKRIVFIHSQGDIWKKIEKVRDDNAEHLHLLDESILDKYRVHSDEMTEYMAARGFTGETLSAFDVGWDGEAICIPVRDQCGRLVGISKRFVSGDKKYKDSGLKKSMVLFNIDKAIRYDSVIIVEGPMDAMKVYQAGFPNVVATMGGFISETQTRLLRSNFSEVTIFTDNDDAGRVLADKIQDACGGMRIFRVIYPRDAKDPGELTEEEIKGAISNRLNAAKFKIIRRMK